MTNNPRIATPQGGSQVVKASGLYPGDRECNSHPPYQERHIVIRKMISDSEELSKHSKEYFSRSSSRSLT